MPANDLFTSDFLPRPYWWDAAEPAEERDNALPERADVAIIGGGYTGLSCALELRRQGIEAVVIEADRIGFNASSRNGGLVTGGVKLALSDFSRELGKERANRLTAEAIGTLQFLEG